MIINKEDILAKLINQTELELQGLIQAAQNTYEIATHEENKPENEYDTRGLEASYLAGAQAERVSEVKAVLHALKSVVIKKFKNDDPISSTALVGLSDDKKKTWVFILPKGGGLHLKSDNVHIQVVTPISPLGEALVGQRVGESVFINIGESEKEFEIISVS